MCNNNNTLSYTSSMFKLVSYQSQTIFTCNFQMRLWIYQMCYFVFLLNSMPLVHCHIQILLNCWWNVCFDHALPPNTHTIFNAPTTVYRLINYNLTIIINYISQLLQYKWYDNGYGKMIKQERECMQWSGFQFLWIDRCIMVQLNSSNHYLYHNIRYIHLCILHITIKAKTQINFNYFFK